MKTEKKIGMMVMMTMILVWGASCHRQEYSRNYVSADSADFQHYKKEASNRPSPPARADQMLGDTHVYITYSQPGVKDRDIWGDLVKYNKIWRTGANEATVFSTDKALEIEGQSLPAGDYALYTIPSDSSTWEVILNRKYDVWGAYDYEKELDALRFTVTTSKVKELQERMNFEIALDGQVTFAWEYLRFSFAVKPA
ncbi:MULTISPECIES: DUF2911 domain-containing protein [Reichenbachiella]|uniref:DUF2911 domain-containing protein n=1 Tax=Reichenbachiella TaxID=156993 RepID=UPI001313F7C0|nr:MULTISPECIES: DUF2911 domain-containing protein [Reichenbachiella]MBU2913247.1 DUF2911 domain-containing protein [Reichenbachiella agariperforans]